METFSQSERCVKYEHYYLFVCVYHTLNYSNEENKKKHTRNPLTFPIHWYLIETKEYRSRNFPFETHIFFLTISFLYSRKFAHFQKDLSSPASRYSFLCPNKNIHNRNHFILLCQSMCMIRLILKRDWFSFCFHFAI